jgi:uncharacterized integral membrane protein
MRIKTIIIILITILLTTVLVQNNSRVNFEFLWTTFPMSKLVMLLIVSVVSFILGILVGRPKRVKRLGSDLTGDKLDNGKTNTLSDEDKEYIN